MTKKLNTTSELTVMMNLLTWLNGIDSNIPLARAQLFLLLARDPKKPLTNETAKALGMPPWQFSRHATALRDKYGLVEERKDRPIGTPMELHLSKKGQSFVKLLDEILHGK